MDQQEREKVGQAIVKLVKQNAQDESGWVPFTKLGILFNHEGISYRTYGFEKLRPFLNSFEDLLEFQDVEEAGNPPVCYVRVRKDGAFPLIQKEDADLDQKPAGAESKKAPIEAPAKPTFRPLREDNAPAFRQIVPDGSSWLFNWAFIHFDRLKDLANLALPEKWYYGDDPGQKPFDILYNYLAYTFKRLCLEEKIVISKDQQFAAFNTGLVDQKYEYIYCLFTPNTRSDAGQYWYLVDFVVAGEDEGKKLITYFNPLPERANYFENKIENMLFDSSTGSLSCDYVHILTERTGRFPVDFLEDNCPEAFLVIDGISCSAFPTDMLPYDKKLYFKKLGEKIKDTPRILNRLKNRVQDAVNLAIKRTEWNYKTAIPMYYPARNKGSLLLPLTLVREDQVDLALVVERQPSGSYQGQTVLPLSLAYKNSRLVSRPDSDWLKPNLLSSNEWDNEEDEEDA